MIILVTYINPYVQDKDYGNLGSRVGFVFGGISILAMIWVTFCLPELRGRSLEELDEMFNAKISVWKFSKYKCQGIGARITEIQDKTPAGEEVVGKLVDAVHVESVKPRDEERVEEVPRE